MKRNESTFQSVKARTTDMTQLGKMFVYIALRQLQASTNKKMHSLRIDEICGSATIIAKLVELGVVRTTMGGDILVSKKGAPLVARYFKACEASLNNGCFGKFTWSKRTKFHKEVLSRIA